MKSSYWVSALLTIIALVTPPAARSDDPAPSRKIVSNPIVGFSDKNDLSPPLKQIRPLAPSQPLPSRDIPMHPIPRAEVPSPDARIAAPDPLVQSEAISPKMPSATVSFEGIRNSDNPGAILPPDTNGAVGPNHYVQMLNIVFAIWNKSGTLLYGPALNNTLWTGFGGPCETSNDGDPIVLYDQLADRWLMSQFALPNYPSGPFYQCIAISQTPDPTASWYRYQFQISATKLNDYPKFGVWPDGYYMTVNQFDSTSGLSFSGAGVVAFERSEMLLGNAAQMFYFDTNDTSLGGMLPSDLDGATPPPAGTPNYVLQADDNNVGYPQDRLEIWEFHVDWATPANSTFSGPTFLATAPFDSTLCGFSSDCVPQPGVPPPQRLDGIADRLMFRLAYRNFGTHQSLVTNHTVDADGSDHAGVRWYELRKTGGGWFIQNQGTYAPDSDHRWMGSAAMDQSGNIALGYSVSSGTTYPSIRYAGRLAGDPANQLSQGEAGLIAGSGAQTDNASRWGDYSSMSVDPSDDCTFWYTQEYYATTSSRGWQTRIGAFKFPACGLQSDLSILKTDSSDPVLAGTTLTYTLTVDNAGPDDATGVTVTDTLPGSVTYQSYSASQGSCGQAAGIVTCDLGNIANGNGATVTIDVIPQVPGSISNTAVVDSDQADPNTGNNSATEPTTVNAETDLSISKTDSDDPADRDVNFTYTITVTNNGPSTATGVTVTDPLPAQMSFVSATPDQGSCGYVNPTVTCNLGTLASGSTADVAIVVNPTIEGGPYSNTADVTGNETDLNLVNNSATENTTVQAAVNLSVIKTDSPDPVVVGNNLMYTITASNSGPSTATGVTLSDTLPPTSVNYVSDTGGCIHSGGDPGGTVDCNFGTLDAGTQVIFQIEVSTLETGFISNSVDVTSIEDPSGANDTESTGVTAISVSPVSHDFGSVAVGGSSSPQTFTIMNVSTTSLTINSVGTGDPEFPVANDLCSGQTLSASGNCTVDVSFAPKTAGTKNAFLSIDSPDSPPPMNVPLSGTQNHALTVTKSGTGSGTVVSEPAGIACGAVCQASFTFGTPVDLIPAADSNSVFTGWTGDADCSDGNVTITGDTACNAVFTLKSFTVSVTKTGTGGGTVSSNPAGIDCGSDCSEPYTTGTGLTLTATPAADSAFAGWSGDCAGSSPATLITVDSDKGCVAAFDLITHTLSITRSGKGTGTVTSSPAGIDCGPVCSQDYALGTDVSLDAVPATGSVFSGWTGNVDCADGMVGMDSDKTCDALFILSGDLDGSGRIDGFDLGLMGLAFGSRPGDANWNSDADLDGDGTVGNGDLDILFENFGIMN
jgi:uncharacterized repeat protein (TIGR01451 family)